MRSTWAAAGAGVLLLAGLTTVNAVAGSEQEPTRDRAEASARAGADDRGKPPPWAHGRKHRDGAADKHGKGKPDHSWKAGWKAMTPAERQARMDELAKEHADGMRAFEKCVADARKDAARRAACEKPLPPGQAKRR